MSTMPGKIKTVVADQATAVGASLTVNGNPANKGTATDVIVVLSNTGGSGTVTPTIQGANVAAGPWFAVNPDKASVVLVGGTTLPALAGAASVVQAHLAQLQYQLYRVQYVSAAASGTTATDIFEFMPVADAFDAAVQ